MDIRQLRVFIAVFEERNITAAAQRLALTQPTLSATLRALEDELGTVLFLRLPRGVEACDSACRLYPQAKRLLADTEALTRQFQQAASGPELRLGMEADLGDSQLDGLLQRCRDIPGLQLALDEGCSGDARLGCESQRCEDELFLPLWEEDFVLALPSGHRLAGRRALDGADTGNESWIMCPAHAAQQRLLAILGAHAPRQPLQAGSLRLAARMVAAGMGIAWLPQSLLQQDMACATLEGTPYRRRIGLCYAPDAARRAGLALLLATLAAHPSAGDLQAGTA